MINRNKSPSLHPPEDGSKIVTLKGLHYKVGRHGLVFVWLDGAWKRSTKEVEDLKPVKYKRMY